MYTFQLKEKNYTRILFGFHIITGLILFFDFLYAGKSGEKDWIFSSICLIASLFLLISGSFAKIFAIHFDRHLALLLFESLLMSGGIIYFWSQGASLLAVTHALLAGDVILFWIYLKKRKDGEKIVVTKSKIIIPTLFNDRMVQWNELTNMVKKDDLLTIDFKDNRLLQTKIIYSDRINENEFNQFCREQLDASN